MLQRLLPAARLGIGLAALALGGCSLGNIKPDACSSDTACALAFGAGSRCLGGFCSGPAGCTGDKDCALGKCVGGSCQASGCEGQGTNGQLCFSCPPKAPSELQNACTPATCVRFDNGKRLTKLKSDGSLPALP